MNMNYVKYGAAIAVLALIVFSFVPGGEEVAPIGEQNQTGAIESITLNVKKQDSTSDPVSVTYDPEQISLTQSFLSDLGISSLAYYDGGGDTTEYGPDEAIEVWATVTVSYGGTNVESVEKIELQQTGKTSSGKELRHGGETNQDTLVVTETGDLPTSDEINMNPSTHFVKYWDSYEGETLTASDADGGQISGEVTIQGTSTTSVELSDSATFTVDIEIQTQEGSLSISIQDVSAEDAPQ